MEEGILTLLIVIGLFILGLIVLVFLVPFGLWLMAKRAGVHITLLDLMYMKMRRLKTAAIVRSMIMAAEAGIEVQLESLEAHSMAGGNVESVVSLMIIAKNKNKQLSFEEACEKDLAKEELTKQSK